MNSGSEVFPIVSVRPISLMRDDARKCHAHNKNMPSVRQDKKSKDNVERRTNRTDVKRTDDSGGDDYIMLLPVNHSCSTAVLRNTS